MHAFMHGVWCVLAGLRDFSKTINLLVHSCNVMYVCVGLKYGLKVCCGTDGHGSYNYNNGNIRGCLGPFVLLIRKEKLCISVTYIEVCFVEERPCLQSFPEDAFMSYDGVVQRL